VNKTLIAGNSGMQIVDICSAFAFSIGFSDFKLPAFSQQPPISKFYFSSSSLCITITKILVKEKT